LSDGGTLLTGLECNLLKKRGVTSGAYLFGLSNGLYIDAEDVERSNFLRYINHGRSKANCVSRSAWDDDFISAIYFEATRRIEAGEELLVDYGDYYWEMRKVDDSADTTTPIAK